MNTSVTWVVRLHGETTQALTDDNFYASGVTCGDHVCELSAVTALGGESVRDGLIIRPPL